MDAGLCTAAYQRRVVFVRPGAGYTACSSSFSACEMLRVFDTVIIVRGKGHCKGVTSGDPTVAVDSACCTPQIPDPVLATVICMRTPHRRLCLVL
jgi:hypothetical protein